MADPDNLEEEDLFADLYEGDENETSKDQIAMPSQPSTDEPTAKKEEPGYGQEPDVAEDSTEFEVEMQTQDYTADTAPGKYEDESDMFEAKMEPEPGIQMKEDGKMFIGGLNWETTDQSLHDYFSQFGDVHECTVMRDGATGRSRGFGFLTFKDPKTVNTVMVKEHFLDGKIIDPKRAIPKDEQEKTAKIFVGGVSQDATEADFTSFFAQFGRVIDATLMMDKDTGRPRGFGFVTFDNDAAVERVLDYHPLEILGKLIEVKRAQPRGKIGEEEDFGRGGRGRGKFGSREERFNEAQPNQAQSQAQGQMGNMNGLSPQMMAQYWQRMQQYFAMMQQNYMQQQMMGGMNQMSPQMNPQMMQQMQQMMKQQGGGQMNPQMMQMMQMQMQNGGMNAGMGNGGMGNGGMGNAAIGNGGQRPTSGAGNNRGGFSPQEQIAFEHQKYEQQARRSVPPTAGRGNFQGNQGGGPQSWEGMYEDVPPPEGAGRGSGVVRNHTPSGGKGPKNAQPAQPSNAPANAPTGPRNPGKAAGGGGGGFRGGRGRWNPYGR